MQDKIKKFEAHCAARGLRVTPQRLLVFKILQEAGKPLTAYEVLEKMDGVVSNPKPPTAYRALEFLEQNGFAHRIESLNAYVACDVDHLHEGSQFMICDACGGVEEIHLCHLPRGLQDKVATKGFTLNHWNVEVHGKCKGCGG